jgi:hypothetical protein
LFEDLLHHPSRSAEWTRELAERALNDLAAAKRIRLQAMRGGVAAWALPHGEQTPCNPARMQD